MYLKLENSKRGYEYILSESYLDEGCWKHRELINLGSDPEQYILYPGGNGFYFKEEIEETLRAKGSAYSMEELESLLVPFLKPQIRRVIEQFDRSASSEHRWKTFSPQELLEYHKRIHPFDKRRIHFLRCGRVDTGDLDSRPWKFFNVLLDKSRDEIENMIREREQILEPYEVQTYLYTALHLQTYFRHLTTRNKPETLDPERLDQYFLEHLCRLNREEGFFQGVENWDPGMLHDYLKRYVILYFDSASHKRKVWQEYTDDFAGRPRFCNSKRISSKLSPQEKEACLCLGILPETFREMNRDALQSHFRKQAKKTHPDAGGEKRAFVKMTEAYECLLRLLRS